MHSFFGRPLPNYRVRVFRILPRRLMLGGLWLLIALTARAGANPDLELNARFINHNVVVGAVEEVVITLRNVDPDQPATGITVSGSIDPDLTLMGRTPTQGSYNVASHTWTVGTLPPGGETTLRLFVRVEAAGTFDVIYQVAAQGQPDADSAPNNDSGNQDEDDEDRARARTAGGCPTPTNELVVTTACNDNGTTDPLDDYYIATFEVNPPGVTYWLEGYTPTSRFTASVTNGNMYTSSAIPIGDEIDWYISASSGGSGCYYLHTTSPISCTTDQTCYTAADEGKVLYRRDVPGGVWSQVGALTITDIESMTYNPVLDELYTVSIDQFGILNVNTATFTPVGPPIGVVDNGSSPVNIDDVDGITYDIFTDRIWAVGHRSGGNTVADILFQINPNTGTPIADAFGPGIDYVSLQVTVVPGTGESLLDAADVVIDPRTGKLYVVKFGLANKEYLVEYNKQTGAELNVVGNFSGMYDVEGITFNNRDEAFVTTGDRAPTSPSDYRDAIYPVDINTGLLSGGLYIDFGGNSDFEGVACMTETPGTISGTFFHDTSENGLYESGLESGDAGVTMQLYHDANGNGLLDPGTDILLHEAATDPSGGYVFRTAYIGDYLVRPDPTTVPAGRSLTTTDLYSEKFTRAGQTAAARDFGAVDGCEITATNLSAESCDFNGTPYDTSDDRMSFTLNPTATSGSTTYTVSVSSGMVSPTSGAYGSPTTFYTSSGSGGGGNIVITVRDTNAPACTADAYLLDTGVCPCPQICLPVALTRTFD